MRIFSPIIAAMALTLAPPALAEDATPASDAPVSALPAAAMIPACNFGPFIVFFDWDSAELNEYAKQALDQAVASFGDCGSPRRIYLAGHADRSGPAVYNLKIGERRNAAVRDYLIEKGIPAERFAEESFGEMQSRVPTPDGVREPQNRRVEIVGRGY